VATEHFINSYTQPRKTDSHTLASSAGNWMKTQGTSMLVRDGTSIRLIPSASSPYLLPDLQGWDFSLLKRGTMRSHRPSLAFHSGLLRLDGIGHQADLERWASWLSQPGAVVMFPVTERAPHSGEALVAPITTPSLADHGAPEAARDVPAVELDLSTATLASRIYELSGLDDEQLAALFKVQRETFNRWRAGVLTNPRAASRRRLALLLRLFEDLAARSVPVKDWLLNTIDDESRTPYDLLRRGRIDAVAYLAATIGTAAPPRRQRARDEDELVFGEDDVWELADHDDDG